MSRGVVFVTTPASLRGIETFPKTASGMALHKSIIKME